MYRGACARALRELVVHLRQVVEVQRQHCHLPVADLLQHLQVLGILVVRVVAVLERVQELPDLL